MEKVNARKTRHFQANETQPKNLTGVTNERKVCLTYEYIGNNSTAEFFARIRSNLRRWATN